MTTVNMRPGKAQTFGIVEGTPVFGLPGNPAAAYVGFQMLIRPALRTMQGYRFMDHPVVKARLTADEKNRDPAPHLPAGEPDAHRRGAMR